MRNSKLKALGSFCGRQADIMKECGLIIRKMVTESMLMLMVVAMNDSSKMIKFVDLALVLIMMVHITMASIKMVFMMVMAN